MVSTTATASRTLYAHLDRDRGAVGQSVDQGDLLGTSARPATPPAPHLHFEERYDGKDVRAVVPRAAFAFGYVAAVAELPRRAARRATSYGDGIAELAVFRPRPRPRSDRQPTGRSSCLRASTASRWSATGTATACSTSAYATLVGPHVLPQHPARHRQAGDGQPQRPAGRRRLGRRRLWEIGVRKARSNVFRLRPDGKSIPVRLGNAGDLPVTGDWNGDGITDLGVFDQTKATLHAADRTPTVSCG